ncbi:MAG: DUF1657 domain-containing protein [Bacillota bacterium]
MTVGKKLHTTLSQAESVAASLKSFGLDTDDQQAAAAFNQLADIMDKQVVPQLRARLNYIESEEPQYKVRQQTMQQAQQQMTQQTNQTNTTGSTYQGNRQR